MPPNAFFRLQALQPGLGVQGGSVAADPDYAVSGAPASVLHLDYRRRINYAGGAVQACAPAADVPGIRILLKRMTKGVYSADAHAQPRRISRLRTECHAPL